MTCHRMEAPQQGIWQRAFDPKHGAIVEAAAMAIHHVATSDQLDKVAALL